MGIVNINVSSNMMVLLIALSGILAVTLGTFGGGLHSENIYGEPLAKCDRPAYFEQFPERADHKYPTTGYYRNNECTASAADAGAHFVCVEMGYDVSLSGKVYSTFWTETGQAKSPDDAANWPKPGPWCICMWAFARMFQHHPNFIDLLQCDATNQWVIENYELSNPSHAAALHAICNKCGVANDVNASTPLRDKCHKVHTQFGTIPSPGRQEQLEVIGASVNATLESDVTDTLIDSSVCEADLCE